MLIPSDHRRNIKYLFLFQQGSNKEIKKLFDEFGGAFTKLADFNRALKLCTSNYGCMVIDCLNPSTDITEKIFCYHAFPIQPDFEVGARWWWKQLDEIYNPDWEKELEKEEDDDDDEDEPPKKKRKAAAKKVSKRTEDLDLELEE
jgi:hypothetical protein